MKSIRRMFGTKFYVNFDHKSKYISIFTLRWNKFKMAQHFWFWRISYLEFLFYLYWKANLSNFDILTLASSAWGGWKLNFKNIISVKTVALRETISKFSLQANLRRSFHMKHLGWYGEMIRLEILYLWPCFRVKCQRSEFDVIGNFN